MQTAFLLDEQFRCQLGSWPAHHSKFPFPAPDLFKVVRSPNCFRRQVGTSYARSEAVPRRPLLRLTASMYPCAFAGLAFGIADIISWRTVSISYILSRCDSCKGRLLECEMEFVDRDSVRHAQLNEWRNQEDRSPLSGTRCFRCRRFSSLGVQTLRSRTRGQLSRSLIASVRKE